jgi:hypothetical protein
MGERDRGIPSGTSPEAWVGKGVWNPEWDVVRGPPRGTSMAYRFTGSRSGPARGNGLWDPEGGVARGPPGDKCPGS